MYYLLQEGLFQSRHEMMIVDCLERFELDYEWVKVSAKISEIEFKTDRQDIICFGSVLMSHLAKKYNWHPGSFYNANHDYEIYSKFYKNNLLNYDSLIINIKDKFEFDNYNFFARPCGDNKAFTGKHFNKESWKVFTSNLNLNGVADKFYDINVQICSLKNIQQEFRCWIVNGECITISQYKLGEHVLYKNFDYDETILDFVNQMTKIYQPADAFVMDVCFVDNELKIVEINNLNCAGFYDCNMQKLINSLEENF